MSVEFSLTSQQALDTPCSHGENFDDKVFDRLLIEPSGHLEVSRSHAQLEILHRLPAAVTRFLYESERTTLLHSVRVSLMSRIGARIMGTEAWEQDRIELSGLTHDLGKQIPEISAIVHNGRALTSAERSIVNKHAQYGFEMLYNAQPNQYRDVRGRIGNFMGHVALDVLFSHSRAKSVAQRGISNDYLTRLVDSRVLADKDAENHVNETSVQLLTVADVTDALLSTGMERAYRIHRLTHEGRSAQIDPNALPDVVGEVVDVPAVDLTRVVPELTKRYAAISKQANYYVNSFQSLKA